MIICLIGPPGSGKDTQARILQEKLGVGTEVISPGEVLRNAVREQHILAVQIKQYMDTGKLVPDNIVNQVMRDRITVSKPQNIVFTGFPRREEQIQYLDDIIKDYNQRLHAVILLQIPDEIVIERVTGRLYSPHSRRVYHEKHVPPRISGRDDITGYELIRRSDDNPQAVAEKLNVHKRHVAPIKIEFQQRGILHKMEATGSVQEVASRVWRIVQNPQQDLNDLPQNS